MSKLDLLLKRGFGVIAINEVLTLRYANGVMQLVIAPLPGFSADPMYFDVISRECKEIIQECQLYMDTAIHMLRDQYWEDILYNIEQETKNA